ncbi:MAG TPA: histidine phosphatase family protein [Williamwhitmania sp.]|jgi:phosphohistidine phosphatase|nr:histidine phosphatase family protein [Williamwhitmania sp.]
MKQLILVRHGKASVSEEAFEDVDRPLKLRGIKDSLAIAKTLKEKNITPTQIISSHAARACHTATIFAECLHYPLESLSLTSKLYSANLKDILDLIHQTEDKISVLLLVGHNPTFTYATNEFLKDPIYDLPTAGVAILNFSAEGWQSISRKSLSSSEFVFPKKD